VRLMELFRGRGPLIALGAGLAPFFLYLELLKSMRSSQWGGVLPEDWIGVLLAALLYASFLGVLTAVAGPLASRIRGHLAGFGLFVAGGVAWALLSVHREVTPTSEDAMVAGVLLAFTGAAWFGTLTDRFTLPQLGAALAALWLSGLAALYGAGDYFLFSPSRARDVTVYPMLWLPPVGIALMVLLLFRPRYTHLALIGLVGICAPLLFVRIALYAPERPEGTAQPNMVFIMSDTLRADYCSVYGGDVATPRLEELAASGVLFDRHYALSPWTLPSLTGLYASQYPKSLTPDGDHVLWTLEMNCYEVDYSEPTLPMRLEAAGYRTGAFTANAFLPVVPGMMLGFQERASSHPILLVDNGYFNQMPFLSDMFRAWFPSLVDIRPHNTTRDLDHYARAFVRRHRDKPFYLYIHYIDPHAPYDPPEALRRVTEGPWPFFHPYVGGEAWGIPILGQNFAVAPPDREYVRSLYEGEITYIDGFVGRIRDALAEAGLEDSTYFCFTSDHGEELWDHGKWGHGQSLYEEQLRVPLILSGPSIAPRAIAEPVSALHLVPTLAELLGVEPAGIWRGRSLVPVLRGEADLPADEPVFALGTSNSSTENPQHMVIVGRHKLIRMDGVGGGVTLFDLEADPGELRDIAAAHPDVVARLTQLLDEWLASFSPYFDVTEVEFNREMEQGLEGMGYL